MIWGIVVVHLFLILVVLVVIAIIAYELWDAVEECIDIYDKDFQEIESGGNMVRVLEVIEANGKDYVPLEEYQKLMSEYEKLVPACSNEEIIKAAGEDEVYTG